jgi:hypothetical protein
VSKRTLWLGALIAAAVTAVIAMLLIPPADRDDPDVKVIEPDLQLEGDLPVPPSRRHSSWRRTGAGSP